ncbi:MAG: metallophosphoesterase [Planctomycetes bacterium]|nr:metallophosphoesterase [Planctomycetota bacterium]
MKLVIGDIHACYEELLDLLELAGLGEEDEILAVGDLVDRGPDNQGVLDFFRRRPRASSILGNHERKHLRSARGEIKPAPSQIITRAQLGERYDEALGFLAGLPRHCDWPEAYVVHGFWEPGVPLEKQRDTVVVGTLSGEHHLRKHYDRPWYELYDGSKPLIVGHLDYRHDGQPLIYQDKVFAIDTGCCHGGRLTGLLLPAFRILSVPARADHWRETCRRFAHLVEPGEEGGRQ